MEDVTDQSKTYYCGFVSLIGRPNIGKSTLMNHLLGQKISIATPKPQTTRNRILGIKTENNKQIIFMDTPGIHQSRNVLNQRIVSYAIASLHESDSSLLLVPPLAPTQTEPEAEERRILEQMEDSLLKKSILIINKIDLTNHESILHTIDVYRKYVSTFAEIVPISALKKRNTTELQKLIFASLPESHFYFAADQVTSASERFLVAEFIREQVFLHLQQEIPYSVAVQIEAFQEEKSLIRILSTIVVERESQKGILIGHQGKMLKKIGSHARKKIEYLLGKKVFLSTHVKVLRKWSSSPTHLDSLGFPENLF